VYSTYSQPSHTDKKSQEALIEVPSIEKKPKHLLAASDLSGDEIRLILDTAQLLKQQRKTQPKTIEHKEGMLLAMIFEKQSLRTRVSFETAFHELGGTSSYLTKNDIEMGKRESIADTAQVLSRWCSMIVARLYKQSDILELAKHATVPVINALTDAEHPCQALADLLTIEEHFGTNKLKLAWVGDGNNVANSFAVTAARLGHEVVICTPPGYEAAEIAYQQPGVTHCYSPSEAVAGAHAVYTDVWVSMGQEQEMHERLKRFRGYMVSEGLMAKADADAIFLHCLPAIRDVEVESAVIDGPQSVVFDQSENRLHAQKALMQLILEGAL
jgi:ornithine carbamoyltransferase